MSRYRSQRLINLTAGTSLPVDKTIFNPGSISIAGPIRDPVPCALPNSDDRTGTKG